VRARKTFVAGRRIVAQENDRECYEAYAEGVRLLQADNFHAAVVALARAR